MSQQAAKRRRRQALNGYTHIHKAARPLYKKRSKEVLAARLARIVATERRMSAGKKKK